MKIHIHIIILIIITPLLKHAEGGNATPMATSEIMKQRTEIAKLAHTQPDIYSEQCLKLARNLSSNLDVSLERWDLFNNVFKDIMMIDEQIASQNQNVILHSKWKLSK